MATRLSRNTNDVLEAVDLFALQPVEYVHVRSTPAGCFLFHVHGGCHPQSMEQVSVFRLRFGVILIGIWWIPVWLLAPLVAHLIDRPVGSIALAIAIIQTIIGLIGALLAGRQAAKIVRHTRVRAVPGKIWRVLWTGRLIDPEPTEAAGAPDPSS